MIAVDVCRSLDWMSYGLASAADLEETGRLVEDLDRRVVVRRADVRDLDALGAAVADGVSELGRLDIVCANAGIIASGSLLWEIEPRQWRDVVDVNVTGVFHTIKAAVRFEQSVPHMAGGVSLPWWRRPPCTSLPSSNESCGRRRSGSGAARPT